MLLGGKFIIQEIVNSDAGTELGGSRIKFAKFDGYDENGRIKIKKIMYAWNQKSGQVMRGNWEGPWTKDNNSEMVNPHEIGRLTHAKDGGGKGYLFFREITYDQDEKYGLVGRTVVLVGLKIVKSEKHIVELHTAIGPRYINSRDREPFWNENELSVMDYKEFEK
jgi:hypothetical protein